MSMFCALRALHTLTLCVPGIGMTSSPCPSSQASVTCPAVTLCLSPIAFKLSTSFNILGKFSFEKRGISRRKSFSSKSSGPFCPEKVSHRLFPSLIEDRQQRQEDTYISARQKSATKGRIGNNCDSKLTRRFQDSYLLIFNIKGKGRVFDLEGRDGVHSVGATKRGLGDFGQADVFHFSRSG